MMLYAKRQVSVIVCNVAVMYSLLYLCIISMLQVVMLKSRKFVTKAAFDLVDQSRKRFVPGSIMSASFMRRNYGYGGCGGGCGCCGGGW